MSGPQTFDRLSEAVLDEHRQIHFYLDRISQTLEKLRAGMSDVEPMRRLAAELAGLTERLKEHHQSEENGGLFQAILEVMPASRVEIDRLVNEHGKMIEVLELAQIHAQRGEASEAEALRIDLQRFLDMFREHEEAEERLLAQAIGEGAPSTD